MRSFSLYNVFDDLPALKVVDVGASPIDGPPPYQMLLNAGRITLVGFEPDPDQHRALLALHHPRTTYLPYAIGDGSDGLLHICKAAGMTSLLEPDVEVLGHFHGFAQWGAVLRTVSLQTKRLDDIPEAGQADYLKLDVQGGELAAIRGASGVLQNALAIHVEAQFVPFYKDQPLFAELDQALRRAGFFFHRFMPITSRVFQPMVINNDLYAGLSQQLWSDAVYFKRFTDFARLEVAALLKIAVIAHDVYTSVDLGALALKHVDQKENGRRVERYLEAMAK